MSGMAAQQRLMDVIANNLANINTTGFRAETVQFHDLLMNRVPTTGAATPNTAPDDQTGRNPSLEGQVSGGIRVGAIVRDFEVGKIQEDGVPLHSAIDGEGFFIVRQGDGGAVYTRDGTFRLDPLGRLVTSGGDIVLPETRVPADARDVHIRSDGTIFARFVDDSGDEFEVMLGEIQVARFTNPHGLASIGQNLFVATEASGEAEVGYPGEEAFGSIRPGATESSNVDLAEQMTSMVIGQRAYALSARAMQTLDEMMSLANNLRR
ncbi:MAG: flagellar hook-basal body complex protein [Chloroflexota bacterium]|nr:MAG: flagellar hook-basal body complex protein [Chloroflexota bacterium]